MKEQIEQLIEQHMFPHSEAPHHQCANPERLDAAAMAIAKLVETHPMDRVRAMAATVFQNHMGDYKVQGNGMSCLVWESDGWHCSSVQCPLDCDHILAVELYRAQKENEK